MFHTSQRQGDDAVDILLVEDDPAHVRLTREAFGMIETATTFSVVTDGDAALDFLAEGTDGSGSLPDLVLLDLDLPGRDGCEILERLRDELKLQFLPVIVLSGSRAREDITACYSVNANAYLTKPSDLDGFISMTEAIERFWFERARLPPTST